MPLFLAVAVLVVIVLALAVNRRCSNCGRWWATSDTGRRRPSGEQEWECRHCSAVTWKVGGGTI